MTNIQQDPSLLIPTQTNHYVGYEQLIQTRANQILSKYYGPNSRVWHMLTQNNHQNYELNVYENSNQQSRKRQNTRVGDPKYNYIYQQKITEMISFLQQTGLKLKYDQTNYNDIQELYVLLKYYLQYPIQRLADKHIKANSFNIYDINNLSKYQLLQNTNQIKQVCQCCSLPVPQKILSDQPTFKWICLDIKNIGISTRLFFQTQFVLGIMLILMFIIFCVYAISTNFNATIKYLNQLSLYDKTLQILQQLTYEGLAAYSPGSLIANQTNTNQNKYEKQKILGYVTLTILIIIYFLSKLWERKQMKLTKQKYPRAETFTLLINNLPAQMKVHQLEMLLNQYFNDVLSHQKQKIEAIKEQVGKLKQNQISKFRQAFYQLKNDQNPNNIAISTNMFYQVNSKWIQNYQKQLNQRINLRIVYKINKASLLFDKQSQKIQQLQKSQYIMIELRKYFEQLIKTRQRSYNFNQSVNSYQNQNSRYEKYSVYRQQRKRIQQLKINKNDDILKQKQLQLQKMPTFVTFTNRWFLQKLYIHQKKQPLILKNQNNSNNIQNNQNPQNPQNNNKSIKNNIIKADIQQAPAPQDVIWSNIGQSPVNLAIRFIINLVLTFLISILSLIILYLLILQKQDFQNMANNWYYVSYLMIVIILIFKYLIKKIVYSLTKKQYCWTNSHQQASVVFKANLILIFQSTFVPSAISSIGTANLLGQKGLSQIAFYFSLINALLIILSKIIDPLTTIYRIYRYIFPYNKIWYTQQQYNQVKLNLVKKQYVISNQYLQIVDTFVFTCAFAPFQPWVVLPGIIHFWYVALYRKYYLVSQCKRPIPDSKIIQDAAMIFIIMGPALFIFMTQVIQNKSNYQFSSATSILLIIGFFVLFFLFFGICTWKFFKQTEGAQNIYYHEYMNQIIADYDMKNPTTKAKRVEKSRRNYQNNLAKMNNILL